MSVGNDDALLLGIEAAQAAAGDHLDLRFRPFGMDAVGQQGSGILVAAMTDQNRAGTIKPVMVHLLQDAGICVSAGSACTANQAGLPVTSTVKRRSVAFGLS